MSDERDSTHYEGCDKVHPVCAAVRLTEIRDRRAKVAARDACDNVDFIIHAPSDIAWLVAQVERAAEYRAALERAEKVCIKSNRSIGLWCVICSGSSTPKDARVIHLDDCPFAALNGKQAGEECNDEQI